MLDAWKAGSQKWQFHYSLNENLSCGDLKTVLHNTTKQCQTTWRRKSLFRSRVLQNVLNNLFNDYLFEKLTRTTDRLLSMYVIHDLSYNRNVNKIVGWNMSKIEHDLKRNELKLLPNTFVLDTYLRIWSKLHDLTTYKHTC